MGLRELGASVPPHLKTTLDGAPEAEGESCANASFMNSAEPMTVADSTATASCFVRRALMSRNIVSPFPGPACSYERVGSPGRSLLRVSPLDRGHPRAGRKGPPTAGLYSMRRPCGDS